MSDIELFNNLISKSAKKTGAFLKLNVVQNILLSCRLKLNQDYLSLSGVGWLTEAISL